MLTAGILYILQKILGMDIFQLLREAVVKQHSIYEIL